MPPKNHKENKALLREYYGIMVVNDPVDKADKALISGRGGGIWWGTLSFPW